MNYLFQKKKNNDNEITYQKKKKKSFNNPINLWRGLPFPYIRLSLFGNSLGYLSICIHLWVTNSFVKHLKPFHSVSSCCIENWIWEYLWNKHGKIDIKIEDICKIKHVNTNIGIESTSMGYGLMLTLL